MKSLSPPSKLLISVPRERLPPNTLSSDKTQDEGNTIREAESDSQFALTRYGMRRTTINPTIHLLTLLCKIICLIERPWKMLIVILDSDA